MKTKLTLMTALMLLVTFGAAKEKSEKSSHSIEEKRNKILLENDQNKDGKLEISEIDTMLQKKKEKYLKAKQELLIQYDTNKNGKLDEDEKAKVKSDRLQNKK